MENNVETEEPEEDQSGTQNLVPVERDVIQREVTITVEGSGHRIARRRLRRDGSKVSLVAEKEGNVITIHRFQEIV